MQITTFGELCVEINGRRIYDRDWHGKRTKALLKALIVLGGYTDGSEGGLGRVTLSDKGFGDAERLGQLLDAGRLAPGVHAGGLHGCASRKRSTRSDGWAPTPSQC